MHLRAIVVAAALAWPAILSASVVPDDVETFESYADGTAIVYPFVGNDPDFGILSGGQVATPGQNLDGWFQINGSKVYAGNDLLYTTYLGPDKQHCCGFFYLGFYISSPAEVTVEFYTHGGGLEYEDIALAWSTVVSGQSQFLSFGTPADFDPEGHYPGYTEIVEVRMFTADGSLFAIDDFQTAGAAVVPESASWAMMIAGFGLVGASLRRRVRQSA